MQSGEPSFLTNGEWEVTSIIGMKGDDVYVHLLSMQLIWCMGTVCKFSNRFLAEKPSAIKL